MTILVEGEVNEQALRDQANKAGEEWRAARARRNAAEAEAARLRQELSRPCARREEYLVTLERLQREIRQATLDADTAAERENALRPALRDIDRRANEQQEQSQRAELLERRAKARAALTAAEAEWAAADQAFENFTHQKLHRQLTMKGDQL